MDTSSLGRVLGEVLIKTEEVLLEERPDAVLVLGDTNSCLAAVMAKRMRIPVYHMEAGNRCFDENVPEETNRRLVDHVADFNLVYTEHARRNLLAEGLHPRRILKTGSPMKEVLAAHADAIDASDAVERLGLTPQGYVLVSAHREENVDNPDRLNLLLDCLEGVVADTGMPVLVSTHPRTRKRLDALGRSTEGITFHEPLGFMDYNKLQKQSYCVLSDSGHDLRGVLAARLPGGHAARLHRAPRGARLGLDPDDRSRRDQRGRGRPVRGVRHGPCLAGPRRLPHR